jgi:hypothetical protein
MSNISAENIPSQKIQICVCVENFIGLFFLKKRYIPKKK